MTFAIPTPPTSRAAPCRPRSKVLVDLKMQVGTGGLAPVTRCRDLLARPDPLADADERLLDVLVHRDQAASVLHAHPQPEPASGTASHAS